RAALVGVVGGRDLRLAECGDAVHAIAGLLPPGTPVRFSVALEPEAEGTISLVVLFFRSWSGADENAPAAPSRSGGGEADAVVDGQDLEIPTYIRLGLRIDPA
ncbi:MAG: hypothetical protein IJQ73_02835, partial [Kiritimatiellae bacterium]|nr:hypothetical protein [Kiritimatiellia bacterium]